MSGVATGTRIQAVRAGAVLSTIVRLRLHSGAGDDTGCYGDYPGKFAHPSDGDRMVSHDLCFPCQWLKSRTLTHGCCDELDDVLPMP